MASCARGKAACLFASFVLLHVVLIKSGAFQGGTSHVLNLPTYLRARSIGLAGGGQTPLAASWTAAETESSQHAGQRAPAASSTAVGAGSEEPARHPRSRAPAASATAAAAASAGPAGHQAPAASPSAPRTRPAGPGKRGAPTASSTAAAAASAGPAGHQAPAASPSAPRTRPAGPGKPRQEPPAASPSAPRTGLAGPGKRGSPAGSATAVVGSTGHTNHSGTVAGKPHPQASAAKPTAADVLKEILRRDMELYKKHWWPLKPPPHHNPLKAPPPWERQEIQALQGNYGKYWQSLHKFQPSPLLEGVQRSPYFKLRTWRTAAHQVPRPSKPGALPEFLVICHHKTGVNLQISIMQVLPTDRFTYSTECEEMTVGKAWRVVHYVRDPVDVILSGYRYHQTAWGAEIWSWGRLKTQDPPCYECDDDDHRVMFDSCRFNCTYFELLNRLNERSGVITEAVSARKSLTSMVSIMSATLAGNMSNILHLSFNLFKANSTQTAACLLRFLGLGNSPALLAKTAKAVYKVVDPNHITSGLFNDTAHKAFLRKHPVWGPEFREAKELMAEIFRRQAKVSGCPAEEAAR